MLLSKCGLTSNDNIIVRVGQQQEDASITGMYMFPATEPAPKDCKCKIYKGVQRLFQGTCGYGDLDEAQTHAALINMRFLAKEHDELLDQLEAMRVTKLRELLREKEHQFARALLDQKRKKSDEELNTYALKVLAALDLHGISLSKYHNLNMVLDHEVKHWRIEKVKDDLDTKLEETLPIQRPSSDAYFGGWFHPHQVLVADLMQHPVTPADDTIDINIGGDGREADAHNDQTIITMSVMNRRKQIVHKLALLRGGEDYVTIRDGLADLRSELRQLQLRGIDVGGKHFVVRLWMCTDWKFLRIVRGVNACGGHTKHFCPWCLCTKDERHQNKRKILPVDNGRLASARHRPNGSL